MPFLGLVRHTHTRSHTQRVLQALLGNSRANAANTTAGHTRRHSALGMQPGASLARSRQQQRHRGQGTTTGLTGKGGIEGITQKTSRDGETASARRQRGPTGRGLGSHMGRRLRRGDRLTLKGQKLGSKGQPIVGYRGYEQGGRGSSRRGQTEAKSWNTAVPRAGHVGGAAPGQAARAHVPLNAE